MTSSEFNLKIEEGLLSGNNYTSIMEMEAEFDKFTDNKKNTAFAYMDIDNFRYINNLIGHVRGNVVIKNTLDKLNEYFKDQGLVFRVNADEFIVIFEYKDERDLFNKLKGISNEIKATPILENQDIYISISAGVSIYERSGNCLRQLLQNSDTALDIAKKKGKDRFEIYEDAMSEFAYKDVEISQKIKRAFINKQFSMYYQPIVKRQSFELVGLEALRRWEIPGEGFISPMDFIPIAEKTGQILEIEKWVLDEVFRQIGEWQKEKKLEIFVAINLSPEGIVKSGLVKYINKLLEEYDVDSNKIELEITETVMIQDEEKIMKTLSRLKEMGIKVSLDDFGTGYSSLNYLKSLPINKVKLDKSFMDTIEVEEKNKNIITSVINLCHLLELEVVGEGIEENSQLDVLEKIGCNFFQGYYFGKPMDPCKTSEIIRRNKVDCKGEGEK